MAPGGEFFEIIRGQPARYVYFPILLTLGTGLLWPFASSAVHSYVYLGFWAWQAYHYGRQNVGLYSFVSIAFVVAIASGEAVKSASVLSANSEKDLFAGEN